MKINREARQTARQLYRALTPQGQLNEASLRTVVNALLTRKPRNYFGVLQQLTKLVEIYQHEHRHVVESAVALADKGESIFATLRQKFGAASQTEYRHEVSLVGGLRVQVGSNVWDGSVRGRLNNLENNLTQK